MVRPNNGILYSYETLWFRTGTTNLEVCPSYSIKIILKVVNRVRDAGWIPGLERALGEGNDNLL